MITSVLVVDSARPSMRTQTDQSGHLFPDWLGKLILPVNLRFVNATLNVTEREETFWDVYFQNISFLSNSVIHYYT